MRVLLTGAAGFLGAHVCEHLLVNSDYELTLTDSFRHHGISERINEVLEAHPAERSRVQVMTHDLTTPWSNYGIAEMTAKSDVDVILQVASESHVDRSISDPVPFVRNNVDIALNMLELARVIKPKMFLQLSTDEVYGAVPMDRPCVEWDPILPSNPYSASKAAQESLSIGWWRTYDVPLVLVNAMNLLGERQHPEKFVPKVIRAVLNGEPIGIHASAAAVYAWKNDLPIDRSEVGRRCYLHARNLADAMLFIIRNVTSRMPADGPFPHRFNAVGDEVDNLTLAEKIASFLGKPLNFELVDANFARPGHDLAYLLDGSLLESLGWTPPVALWPSLEHLTKWSVTHPRWLDL